MQLLNKHRHKHGQGQHQKKDNKPNQITKATHRSLTEWRYCYSSILASTIVLTRAFSLWICHRQISRHRGQLQTKKKKFEYRHCAQQLTVLGVDSIYWSPMLQLVFLVMLQCLCNLIENIQESFSCLAREFLEVARPIVGWVESKYLTTPSDSLSNEAVSLTNYPIQSTPNHPQKTTHKKEGKYERNVARRDEPKTWFIQCIGWYIGWYLDDKYLQL